VIARRHPRRRHGLQSEGEGNAGNRKIGRELRCARLAVASEPVGEHGIVVFVVIDGVLGFGVIFVIVQAERGVQMRLIVVPMREGRGEKSQQQAGR
jgi:hypothetical protein